jgi:3-oxoacyl-[acyl-carrier protein] reductase
MACSVKFQPVLEASWGKIVIVGSIAGFHSTIGNSAYAASKTGLVGHVRTLGEAWAQKVRVNSIAPGLVAAKITTVTMGSAERRERALAKIPAGRAGTPQDMTGAVMILASDLADFIVGQTTVVVCGRLLE